MDGHNFRMFYENYARLKLAEYLQIDVDEIKHISLVNPSSPYDLEYGKIKYDVKYASPTLLSKHKKESVWDFDLRGEKSGKKKVKYNHCDFYICIGMKNGIPKKLFLIKHGEAPTTHLRISVNGYSKYLLYELRIITKDSLKSQNVIDSEIENKISNRRSSIQEYSNESIKYVVEQLEKRKH